MTENSKVRMATSISIAVCEHGHVYIQLNDRNGNIFAAGAMSNETGLELAADIVRQISEPNAKCGAMH